MMIIICLVNEDILVLCTKGTSYGCRQNGQWRGTF